MRQAFHSNLIYLGPPRLLRGHGMIETEVRGRPAVVDWIALHYQVLVVAKANPLTGDWKAYCAPVPGENHDNEWLEVFEKGSPISLDRGEFLFPRFAERFQWRR